MRKTFLIPLALFFQSCIFNQTDNIQELGNNYYYIGDGKESQILLGKSGQRSGGETIVPEEVTHYDFNSEYIIARNLQDRYKSEIKFWIIDKKQETQPIPLDSIEFTNKLQTLNINLYLKPRR
ncbi:DUF3997 domain-containing protein [Rufibacter psychrotolerans]|uniref:DUF3997 domain-containing protein n=1 Tax=Rufibacter psychrotolerans TaxID=2812556 RepID=UPI00196803E4|nr:DUF3997 domain-containing protein [Rufibacter sp. SYSU D00308]